MQEIIVVIVLLAAMSYGGWRIYKVFLNAGDPCSGCAGCPLKGQKKAQKKKKEDCWHKK
jgi:hypothetical protein